MRHAPCALALALLAGCAATPADVPAPFARGADISWLEQQERSGQRFSDDRNQPGDALALLRDVGLNALRLRVWVDPVDGLCDSEYVVRLAHRAAAHGYRLMIDFHYSDHWADPGQQTVPRAWRDLDAAHLDEAVRAHTTTVLQRLHADGIPVDWIQIGNEINSGMLWPQGKTPRFAALARLINSGAGAARAVYPKARIVVHLANGYDNSAFRWFFDNLRAAGVDWDVIAMSHYPPAAGWPERNALLDANMRDMIARYGKPVMVAETGMDWREGAATNAMLADLLRRMRGLPSAPVNALGVFYWEPQAAPGWQGYNMGALLPTGQFSIALRAFRDDAAKFASGVDVRLSPGR
jgi:arabinogalactan endo-1,4-beta-galactosidase